MAIAVTSEVQQSANYNATTGTTETVTITVGAGASIDLYATGDSVSLPSGSVSSSPSATWTQRDSVGNSSTLVKHYTADGLSAGSYVITITWVSAVAYRAMLARQITGTSGYDSAASAAHAANYQNPIGSTAADTITSGNTSALSSQPALISGFTANITTATDTPSAGTGFSTLGSVWPQTSDTARAEHKRVTATTALAATFTSPGTTVGYATAAAVFLESAPPVITVQPTNQSALIGQTATFSVTASGPAPSSSLVGQQGTGWTLTNSLVQQTGGNAVYYASGYTATAGVATHVYFYAEGATTATVVKFAVYNAAGSLVGVTSSVDITGVGLVSAPFATPVTLTAQVYKIVVVPASGYLYFAANTGSSGFSVNQNLAANFSYASPPSTLPAADASGNGQEFIVWLGTPVTYQWNSTTPPVYDNKTTYSLPTTAETSSSFSHTVGAASNRYLCVFLGRGTGFGTAPTSVTFGGVAMSLLATQQNASWGTETFVYGLMAPASGAGTVAVNWGVTTRGGIAAVSFANTNQTTAYGTIATSQAGTPTVVASSIAGLVVDFFDTDTGDSYPLVADSGQTVLVNFVGSSGANTAAQGIGISTEKGASSVTMSWTGWHSANHIVVPLLSPIGAISGATSSSYTTGTLASSNNGTLYSVDCINTGGTTTSNTVRLLVSSNGVGRLGMFDPEMRILSWF